jgi:hypothetical protein
MVKRSARVRGMVMPWSRRAWLAAVATWRRAEPAACRAEARGNAVPTPREAFLRGDHGSSRWTWSTTVIRAGAGL